MAKPKSHKSQHYVPQCYLRAWCDPETPPGREPYVWLFPKTGGTGRRKAPVNIFAETDMYTIKLPDGGRDLSLENSLTSIEDGFVQVRRDFLSKELPLDTEARWKLCAFVAAMQARVARQRDHHRSWFSEILSIMGAMRAGASEEQRQRVADAHVTQPGDDALGYEDVERLASQPLQRMLVPMIKAQVPILHRMYLGILQTDSDQGFVTSDAPVTWFDHEATGRVGDHVGLGSPTVTVTMPVSPRQLILLTWMPRLQGYRSTPEPIVDGMNRARIANCAEHVITSRNRSPGYLCGTE